MSFDVVSLFTCVPKALATDTCKTAFDADEELCKFMAIDMQDLVKLLDFCLKNYFIFHDVFYIQVHGTPGTSISVTSANLAMESIEN